MARQRGQRNGHSARRWEKLQPATLDPEFMHRERTVPGSTMTCWLNDRYQVLREAYRSASFGGAPMVYLSIKRRDKNTVRDWRHLQAIKNQLIGYECEAFELYPASSRVVDGANQFHLWGFSDPHVRIPVGFATREVVSPEESGATGGRGLPRQRVFEEGLQL